MKAAHYLNQFFAGLGGEEQAETPPVRLDGAVGPGRGLAAHLANVEIVATLACGDDYFAEHEEGALAALLALLEAEKPDVLVAGPAFGSGRYGYACGILAAAAAERGIPAVAAMHPENPGVGAAGKAYVVPTAVNVAGMRDALPRLAALASALAAGRELGSAEEEGYLPRGFRRNYLAEKTGAERAVDLLLSKLGGDTRTEVGGDLDRVDPPAPVADLSGALLALVTEAGCVPQGNPDRLPAVRARGWFRYELDEAETLAAGRYESVHGGFDVTLANEDPNRLVPLDTVRGLEREGRVGRLHDAFYTTTGNGTPVATATKFGQEIAADLRDAGVQAVLLSGT
ncbi:MAG: glycine/betaine/sarcosine/D-proline family reductase selenoprotein B [Gaiellaceae bacterium]